MLTEIFYEKSRILGNKNKFGERVALSYVCADLSTVWILLSPAFTLLPYVWVEVYEDTCLGKGGVF